MILGLDLWQRRHGVSDQALAELVGMLLPGDMPRPGDGSSEARVQGEVRLEGPAAGCRLWRNNVGALKDERGVPVRYGLANDTKALNEQIKSADLIGWRRVTITAAMVGSTIAQFLSRECKPEGWRYTGTPREEAQLRWATLVTSEGGDAKFATGRGTL